MEKKFVFIIKEMLKLMEEKIKTAIKKKYKKPRKCSIQEILKDKKMKY